MGTNRKNGRNCGNCMREAYCEGKSKYCYRHVAIHELLGSYNMTAEDYVKFTREWDMARYIVKKALQRGSRRQ